MGVLRDYAVNQLRWGFVSLALLSPMSLSAQADTSLVLDEVEVTALRIDFTGVGKHTDKLDSTQLEQTFTPHLASMLSRQTPLFVRTYGNGTLATLGIRGGSASHTQLLWNGIPLRNPMIGLVDLALIPSAFIDQASVHYGGHGAAFGSGAVGGLISMRNEPISDVNQMEISMALGSWHQGLGAMKIQYGHQRLRWSTRLFAHAAENNFRYRLNRQLPDRRQVHHRLNNMGLLHEGVLMLSKQQQITARLWYQQSDRQISPTSVQTVSKTAQQDESLRASLHWSRDGRKVDWQLKAAWLDERIDYQDSLILLYTKNHFQSLITEGEMVISWGNGLQMASGLYAERTTASSANYEAQPVRLQYAAFTSLRWLQQDWLWRVQAREEVTDDIASPLLVDFSAEWYGLRHTILKASLSRNYRMPTLNDLYWMPGGNPLLQPERGWTLESGLTYAKTIDKFSIRGSATGYVRTIDQWIMWMPPVKDVSNYWAPINVAMVNSHGLEIRSTTSFSELNWKGMFHLGLDLTWSSFGTALPEFSIQEGDQLFYVPVHNLMSGIQMDLGPWSVHYTHHWFGPSPGINEEVKAADIGTAGISGQIRRPRTTFFLFLQLDNVWDVPYRIIERRPMPGRSVSAGFKVSFSDPAL